MKLEFLEIQIQRPRYWSSIPSALSIPTDDDYVAKKIGDYKAYYNFDAESADERKVHSNGTSIQIFLLESG